MNVPFNYNTLVTVAPYEITSHTGTTIIRGKKFTNMDPDFQWGDCLWINGGSGTIVVENCYFGHSHGLGIETENFTGSLTVRNCLFANVRGGLYLVNSTGSTIVEYCQFINPHNLDINADARDGRGQAVQVNNCSGTIRIRYNKGQSWNGEGYTEDWVSLYKTNGTSGNRVIVEYNIFSGGGPSGSGGGIMTGDNGGSYQTVRFNKLYRPGNYIYAISGGEYIVVEDNKGYQDQQPWSQIGAYCFKVEPGFTMSNPTMQRNKIYTRDASGAEDLFYAEIVDFGDVYIIGAEPDETSCPGDPDYCWKKTNTNDLTLAELAMPVRVIDCIDEDFLWQLRNESIDFQLDHVSGGSSEFPASLHRPISLAGADQNRSVNNATFAGSATTTNGATYLWRQVSGPNIATITTPTSATSTVTGLIDGVYRFRLEVTDDDEASAADWMTITVLLV